VTANTQKVGPGEPLFTVTGRVVPGEEDMPHRLAAAPAILSR
jgi:hypothetical protein